MNANVLRASVSSVSAELGCDTQISTGDETEISTYEDITEFVIPVDCGVLGSDLTIRVPFGALAEHVDQVRAAS